MASWKEAIEAYRTNCGNIDPMAIYGNSHAVFEKNDGYRVYNGTQSIDVSTSEDVDNTLKQMDVPIDQGWNW